MPSKGGSSGSVQTPQLFTPSGLFQGLSQVEGLGGYAQNLFNPLASATNWASNLATAGHGTEIPSSTTGLQTGPQINIGGSATPADQWTSQFNPQNGQITLTNTKTGEQFMEAVNSPQAAQWFSPQQIQFWTQLSQQVGQTAGGTAGGGQSIFAPGNAPALEAELGPFLGQAYQQMQTIPGMEQEAQRFIRQQQGQEEQFITQGNTLFDTGQQQVGEGANLLDTGTNLLTEATTGTGLFPSQQAYVNQAVEAEKTQLGTQLAAEGLGSSTALDILRGEAQQQGAATAGQLIQGNITAAEQEQGVGISEQQVGNQTISLAQQQYNLSQAAAKLVLGGQELKFGEASALAQMEQNLQSGLWTEAMQGYGTLGQMISTAGSLYGVDITGYSNILQSHVQQNEIEAQIAEANAQMANEAASSMGSGLGAIFGSSGAFGSGGLFGSSGLGGLFSGIGSLFGGGAAAGGSSAAAIGSVAALALA